MSLAEKPFFTRIMTVSQNSLWTVYACSKIVDSCGFLFAVEWQELFDVGGSPIIITDTEVEIREAQMDLTSVYKFTVYKWIGTGSKLFRMILIRISNHAYCGPGLGCTVRTDTILWDYYQMYFVLGSLRQSQWSDEPVWILVTASGTLKTPSLLTEQ